MGKRIAVFTWGSFGDLHPYLALALGLKARGHSVLLAAPPVYREKIGGAGLEFAPLRPDLPALEHAPDVARRVMDPKDGTRLLLREFVMPTLGDQYDDARAILTGTDLAVTHAITYGVNVACEAAGVPWLSTALQPLVFVSAHDPPVPPQAPHLRVLGRLLPPALMAPIIALGKRQVGAWGPEVNDLRARAGLKRLANPLFDDQWSPHGTLALFSPALGEPQPDWPAHTIQTGFCFYDRLSDDAAALAPELEEFLSEGEPPIIFTLGTSAVMDAGSFYRESAAAAGALGRRAVLLIGRDPRNRIPEGEMPPGVAAFDYAPYSLLFPRAAAVVHQGGVGTTGQALRAGCPQFVVPFSHDQPDNAERVLRRGAGRWLPKHAYTAARAEKELRRLLEEPAYAERAAEIGRRVRAEDGVGAACDAIERAMSARASRP